MSSAPFRRPGRQPVAAAEARTRAMRQKCQIARKQLRLDEDTYRDVLRRVTGQASSTDCGPSQLDALLAEFRRLGWKPARGGKAPSGKPQVRKIYAIWRGLAPYVEDASDSALRGFVHRQTGRDAPEFLTAPEANKVVEGMKAWLARVRAKATAP